MGSRRWRWLGKSSGPKDRTAPVKLVVHAGKLVAVKVTPGAARLLRKATKRPARKTDYGATMVRHPGELLLAEDDKHTPRDSALQVGAWLGARVYLDIRAVLEARAKNGAE